MKDYDEERLRAEYAPRKHQGLEEAKRLDRKAKLPALVFAISYGTVGALLLGVGMSLAMEVFGSAAFLMAIGIVVGLIGIGMVSTDYPFYKAILSKRKEKFASSIILALNQDK